MVACDDPPVEPKSLAPAQIFKLIQRSTQNRAVAKEWAQDIRLALDRIGVVATQPHTCAIIAVIEQESTFKEQPEVAGLATIVLKKLDSESTGVATRLAAKARLAQRAGNGQTYRSNLLQVKTEFELERWYQEFAAAHVTGRLLKWLGKDIDSLISTLGPMQVSVQFARDYASLHGWPVDGIRPYLHSREGGILYGTAHLLGYPTRYSKMVYRFADFNAGHYASRNAGFQKMVSQLSGIPLNLDGDLLDYSAGDVKPSATARAVELAFQKSGQTAVTMQQLQADLRQEKSATFSATNTYQLVINLYKKRFAQPVLEAMPEIQLKSDKISRKLTTAWFANKVNARFTSCMGIKI